MTAIEDLHAAVQAFSNALCDTADDAGMVTHALVVWEEASFDDEGRACRSVMYAVTGDAATPATSVGLVTIGSMKIRRDVLGPCEG